MKPEAETLLVKAVNKVHVAELLLREGARNDAASRAYYTAFHPISAAPLSHGDTFSSHAQSIVRFNKNFVHNGEFPRYCTAILAHLFEDRQSGVYDVAGTIAEAETCQDVAEAGKILKVTQNYLNIADKSDF